jgi:hypothetical protein
MADEGKIKIGDWVLAWGQVRESNHHPEDVVIEFFSHNEQWAGHIRLDRVQPATTPPPFDAAQCNALRRTKSGSLRRCVRLDQHGKKHEDGKGKRFGNLDVAGFFEEF